MLRSATTKSVSASISQNHKRRPKFEPSLRDEEQKEEMNMSRIKAISIICLLFMTTLVFTSFGGPQTATNNNAKTAQGENEPTMQALLNEVRQLRLAIQKSNLSAYHAQ